MKASESDGRGKVNAVRSGVIRNSVSRMSMVKRTIESGRRIDYQQGPARVLIEDSSSNKRDFSLSSLASSMI